MDSPVALLSRRATHRVPPTTPTQGPTVPEPASPEPSSPGPTARKGGEDEALLASLYEEHAAAVLTFVLRLNGGDRQAAEDTVQETLLRAWRNAAGLRAYDGPVRPWLFTVARRIVIDEHRRASVRPTMVRDEALEFMAEKDDIDRRLNALPVADALGRLSPAHRAVIVELYYRGSKVEEAADTLGIPAGTVKSRAYYALRALRLALEEQGVTGVA